jgi:hypothetical protein
MQPKCHFLFPLACYMCLPHFSWSAEEPLSNYVGRHSCFTVHNILKVLCGKWKPEVFGAKRLQVSHFRHGEELATYVRVYKYTTRCNSIILGLFQDHYMLRVPAVPIIRSTILQLAVIGITYAMDREMCFSFNFKVSLEWKVVTSLNHSDVTTIHSGQTLKWTLPYISRSNVYMLYQWLPTAVL